MCVSVQFIMCMKKDLQRYINTMLWMPIKCFKKITAADKIRCSCFLLRMTYQFVQMISKPSGIND